MKYSVILGCLYLTFSKTIRNLSVLMFKVLSKETNDDRQSLLGAEFQSNQTTLHLHGLVTVGNSQ